MDDVPADDQPNPTNPRSAKEQLGYVLSLPERGALRTGTGLVGGVVRKAPHCWCPNRFKARAPTASWCSRCSTSWCTTLAAWPPTNSRRQPPRSITTWRAKRSAILSNMASLATLHISPLMLLAVVSDVAYGSQVYLKQLAEELKQQGVIAEDSTIDHVNDLLSAVSDASAATGKVFNTPPLSVDSLRETIDETRTALQTAGAAHVLPQAEVRRLWEEMQSIADREGVGLLAVSGAATMHAMGRIATLGRGALSTVKVAGSLLDKHVVEHYSEALREIHSKGLYQSLAETSQPYIDSVWQNFQADRSTITQDLLSGKLLGGAWRAARRWLGSSDEPPPPGTTTPKSTA